jgi:hypothetical protein
MHIHQQPARRAALLAAATASLLLCGCASIVSGQNQSLSVTAKNGGADVAGARCTLANDKGTWYATTPGSVTVRRSFNDLSVNCALDGADPGALLVKSSTKGMAFGNILFGGLIGASVDVSTGAAYDYPEIVVVEMGKTATLAPKAPEPPVKAAYDPNSINARQNPFAAPPAETTSASAQPAAKK